MQIQEITIQRVVRLSGKKVTTLNASWKKPMVGVVSNKGYHIAFEDQFDDLTAQIGKPIKTKHDKLRNALVDNLDFMSLK